MNLCDLCNDTGWHLEDNIAHYCICAKGQRMKAAYKEGKQKQGGNSAKKKEWLPYREPGEDPPF